MRFEVEAGSKADTQLASLDSAIGASVERRIPCLAVGGQRRPNGRHLWIPIGSRNSAEGSR